MDQVFDTEYLSKICPEEQRANYLLLGQKLQEAKDLEDKLHHMKDEDHEWEKLQITLDCSPHNTKNSKYILIRHALAWHNYFKRATEFPDRNIYNYELLDPPLHYLGKKQCVNMREEINNMPFDIVFVSPLLRAVETAQLLFAEHPQKDNIKFVLCPLISEKVSSQYSIYKWGNLTRILSNNGNPIKFDLSQMGQDLEFWQIRMLNKIELIDNLQPCRKDQEEFIVNKFVKKGASIQMEKGSKALKRAKEFLQQVKKIQGPNKIGIISHSQLIKAMLCEGDDPKKVNIKLYNGTILGVDF